MATTKTTASTKTAAKTAAKTKATPLAAKSAVSAAGKKRPTSRSPLDGIPGFVPNVVESSLLASAQRHLADNALSFIRGAFPASEPDRFSLFELALMARFTAAMEGPGVVMNAKAMAKLEAGRSWGDFCTLAWESFSADVIRRSLALGLRPLVPVVTDDRFVDPAQAINKFGGLLLERGRNSCDSIRDAWKIAIDRLERTQVRLVVLAVLWHAMHSSGDVPEQVAEQYELLRGLLINLRTKSQLEALSLGVLVGEEAASFSRQLAKARYDGDRDISYLFDCDGLGPTQARSEKCHQLKALMMA